MRITKRQIRRVIREAMGMSNKTPPSSEQARSALVELEQQIAGLQQKTNVADDQYDPELAEMYSLDAYHLEDVLELVTSALDNNEPAPEAVKDRIGRMDTAVRERIPVDVYYWIFPELL